MRHALRILLLALSIGGCATRPTPTIDAFAQNSANNSFEVTHRTVHQDALVLPVVHDQQQQPQSCGANALASVVNYWRGAGTVSGDALYRAAPPGDQRGYNLAELAALARAQGMVASTVRMDKEGIIRELENGRPVLVPVQVPAVYVATREAPGENAPVVGLVSRTFVSRMGWVLQHTHLGMVSHYLVVVGYDPHRFVVVEPVRGYRTITFDRLEQYRRPFADAALVLSGSRPPARVRAQRPGVAAN